MVTPRIRVLLSVGAFVTTVATSGYLLAREPEKQLSPESQERLEEARPPKAPAHRTATSVIDEMMDEMEEVDIDEAIMVEALKTETTVAEAPAIITVIPRSDLEAMGHRTVPEAIQDIPSFITMRPFYHTGMSSMNRGVMMGSLVLHNAVDLYDTGGGAIPFGDNIPLEMIRSVELVSGPGGVLWGANSFVGVINMVSKTADDLQGVQASAGWGSGSGRPGTFRSYVMGGTKLLDNKIKLLAHVGYQTWHHGELWWPNFLLVRSTAPNPVSPHFMTGPTVTDAKRSHLITLEGNAHWGSLALYWHMPFGPLYRPASFGANTIHETLGEDAIDCTDPANKNACINRVDPARIGRFIEWTVYERYWMLRHRASALNHRLRLETRAYYVHYTRDMVHYTSLPPSSVFVGGVAARQPYSSHRAALNVDADIQLPADNRLLIGGDLTYDLMPEGKAEFLMSEQQLQRLPFYPACPPAEGDNICPIVSQFGTDRITYGIFLDWQKRIGRQLLLDAGARLTAASGKRSLDPVVLLSGTAVWSFMPRWNLKLNFAQGYRPPPLSRTDGNGEGLQWAGNPNIDVERSQAVQGEINAVLLHNYRSVKKLSVRTDYAYTWITDLIGNLSGINQNISDQGIHSVEMLADLRLKRGHWIALSYTFVDSADSYYGKMRSGPNQWLSLRGLFNLYNRQLFLSSNLSVIGSIEDFNRVPSSAAGTASIGNVDANLVPITEPAYMSHASDLSVDRIRALPLWNAGLRFLLPDQRIRLDADFYNLLDARSFYPEGWMDLSAYFDSLPNPRPGFAFFLKGQYTY